MNALSYISSNLQSSNQQDDSSDYSEVQNEEAGCSSAADGGGEGEGSSAKQQVGIRTRIRLVVWSIVLFCPHYLILKPTQFLWFLVTSPLMLIEYGVKSKLHKNRNKGGGQESSGALAATKSEVSSTLAKISENDEDDLSGGGELYLQRDFVKGSLLQTTATPARNSKANGGNLSATGHAHARSSGRSDTSSGNVLGTKKMGRFLFPKKLIPKSVLNAQRRKILVMDLDETLIHSASRNTSHSNSSQGHMVEVRFAVSGVSTLYYVHKRPYCDLFLSKVSKWYDLVVFTASMKEYADPVIDWLESSIPGNFTKRLYRNNCILRDGVGYIKDLSILCGNSNQMAVANLNGGGLGEIILVDNSPVSYALNVDNAIQVEGWISDPSDTDLLTLLPFLEALRYTTDVRDILALKNGEQAFS